MRAILVLVTILSVGAPPITWGAIEATSAGTSALAMAAPSATGSLLIRTFAKVDKTFGAGLAIVADAQPLFTPEYALDGHALQAHRATVEAGLDRAVIGTAAVKDPALLDEAVRLEVIVTDSVVEALALENNLIKQRAPRFNILLRDDKNYPYLRLTTSEAFPRVLVARQVERTGDFYAGPFMPAKLARRTMALTHRLFGIRSCNEVITGDRPQIGRAHV